MRSLYLLSGICILLLPILVSTIWYAKLLIFVTTYYMARQASFVAKFSLLVPHYDVTMVI